jgi:hypothetical protein
MSRKTEKISHVGKQYGRWTVIGELQRAKGHYYQCRCQCGTEKPVAAISLRNGQSTSCGCSRRITEETASVADNKKLPAKTGELFALISQGRLPPADLIGLEGNPAWSIESIAKLLGTERKELIHLLKTQGPRFVSAQRHNAEPV